MLAFLTTSPESYRQFVLDLITFRKRRGTLLRFEFVLPQIPGARPNWEAF